jgi:pimeloyl-ACP methyl ester carboxylesterase
MTPDASIRPFRITTPQSELDDLTARLTATRWPDELPGVGWDYGVASDFLRNLVDHWCTSYDWRHHEESLNGLPQFLTDIDDQRVHFVHVRSTQADATPILLTHGWPSTFADFHGVVAPLTEPAAHGAPDAPAFDVVIPSVPGYAYSGPTHAPGWDVSRIARAWAELMRRLGYGRYLVQGGDFGSIISPAVAWAAPSAVVGVHVNAMINGASVDWNRPDALAGLSAEDIASVEATEVWWHERSGYAKLQSTRPQTLAYALNDSPVGLLAWILDLEWAVGDDTEPGETPVDRDEILTAATIYWLTGTAGSSMRLYKEHGDIYRDMPYNPVPTAIAVFPRDNTLRSLAERHHNLMRFTRYHRGGHFAALQAPDLLVDDIRNFTDQLNGANGKDSVGTPVRDAPVRGTDTAGM